MSADGLRSKDTKRGVAAFLSPLMEVDMDRFMLTICVFTAATLTACSGGHTDPTPATTHSALAAGSTDEKGDPAPGKGGTDDGTGGSTDGKGDPGPGKDGTGGTDGKGDPAPGKGGTTDPGEDCIFGAFDGCQDVTAIKNAVAAKCDALQLEIVDLSFGDSCGDQSVLAAKYLCCPPSAQSAPSPVTKK